MMQSNLLPIAKEAWKYVGALIGAMLIFEIFDLEFLVFISFVLLVAVVFAFRNPERALTSFGELSVLSVSDGVVTSIEELNDTEYAYKIEVESKFFDVGILRMPFNGQIVKATLTNGTRVSKNSNLFNDLNENLELVFEDTQSNKIKVVQRVKKSFAPLGLDVIPLQKLQQTTRYGTMLNGVTALYLPHNFRVNVSVGNELKAAQSLMGYFS